MENIQTRKEFIELLTKRAQESETFRLALRTSPEKTIEKITGRKLPENFCVKVHSENTDSLHIVLPAVNQEELNDAELDAVAGGMACWEDCDGISPVDAPFI